MPYNKISNTNLDDFTLVPFDFITGKISYDFETEIKALVNEDVNSAPLLQKL